MRFCRPNPFSTAPPHSQKVQTPPEQCEPQRGMPPKATHLLAQGLKVHGVDLTGVHSCCRERADASPQVHKMYLALIVTQ